MPLLAVLWLALLHALTLAPTPRPTGGVMAGAVARVALAAEGARSLAVRRAEPPEHALRAAERVAATALSREVGGPPPIGGGPDATLLRAAAAELATADATRRVLRRHGTAEHAIAARGGLLAYFPTAPPLQG
jgi:hypothetical protein